MRPPAWLAFAALAAAAPAAAVDRFEIQVYGPDLNEPGHLGVELHLNYTPDGSRAPAFAGAIPLDRTFHATLEPALGVTEWLELGAYVQSLAAPGRGYRYGGSKLRAKMVLPRRLTGDFFLGLNVEVGRVPREVEEDQWANEFRPILGWSDGRLLVAVNPIFGYALSGPNRFRIELEPAAKVAVNTQRGFALGVEYYADLGFASDVRPLSAQEHLLLGVLDLVEPAGAPPSPWEVNVGVGAGLTGGSEPRWIVKAILGRGF